MIVPTTFAPKPMTMFIRDLCSFDSSRWLAQIKIDGFRAHPVVDNRGIQVLSRHQKPLAVSNLLKSHIVGLGLPDNTMLDAEWTSRREKHKTEELYLFDVLWWDGKWVGDQPFEKRYELLQSIILPPDIILVENIQDDFEGAFSRILGDARTEGLVLKKRGYLIPRLLRESKEIPSLIKIKWRDGPDGNTITAKLIDGKLMPI